jgi:hypothetical protein
MCLGEPRGHEGHKISVIQDLQPNRQNDLLLVCCTVHTMKKRNIRGEHTEADSNHHNHARRKLLMRLSDVTGRHQIDVNYARQSVAGCDADIRCLIHDSSASFSCRPEL